MDILDKQAVLHELGISERTLETWVKQAHFPPPVPLGRRVCWTREALERWKTLTFAYQLDFQPRRGGSAHTVSPAPATRARRRSEGSAVPR